MVNMTCPVAWEAPEDPKPFYHDGQLYFKAHDVGWLLCGIMALIATIASLWLIIKHLTYYTLPNQQRHIVRLLIMVPIYAIVSFMSYLFYHEALYYQTIRDCYEAVLVTSFFYLLLAYTGDTKAEQSTVFRNLEFTGWVWPLGRWKYRPEGLHFLWLMKVCVLQYAIVRPVCTLAAVSLEYFGLYCLASWMPWFGHVWCTTFISISVTVAMYCLVAFYYPIKELVNPYQPILKFLAIKTIVFITFWQDTFLSFLVSFDVIKNTEYFSAEAIQVGINALLQCFWMLIFGFIHIKAFSYRPYRPADRSRTTLRGKALLNVLDFRDWFWEMKDTTHYMRHHRKGRHFTEAEDIRAYRYVHLQRALGRERKAELERRARNEQKIFWKDPPPSDDGDAGGIGGNTSRKTPAAKGADGAPDGPKELSDLEKLAATLDEEDEADGLLLDSRRNSVNHSLDYVSRIYADQANSHEDLYPELSHHHRSGSTVSTSDVHTPLGSGRGTRRNMELSAVEEAEEPVEVERAGRGGAGIGAFGIAGWLGLTGYRKPVEQDMLYDGHGDREKSLYLSADDGQAAAAPTASALSPEASWWRTFRSRLSGSHSRGHSHCDDDGDEFEPLQVNAQGAGQGVPAPVAHRMGQVTEGSWGPDRDPAVGMQALRNASEGRREEVAASPTSIAPDAESPLTRFISTHQDSLTASQRDFAQRALRERSSLTDAKDAVAATGESAGSARWAAPPAPAGTGLLPSDGDIRPSIPLLQVDNERRASLAPYQPSVAPSSKQASIVPSDYGPGSSAAALSRRPTASTNVHSTDPSNPSVSSHEQGRARTSAAASPLSPDKALSTAGPLRAVAAIDDLPPIAMPPLTKKELPAAAGPKGKPIKIVIPSPLSPARYPYGQEGESLAAAPSVASGSRSVAGTTSPRSTSTDRLASIGRASQASKSTRAELVASALDAAAGKPPSTTSDTRAGGGAALASGHARANSKGTVTLGSMSSAQWKAKQEADSHTAEAKAVPVAMPPVSQTAPSGRKPSDDKIAAGAAAAAAMHIPAPSQLHSASAGATPEDPFSAVQSVIRQQSEMVVHASDRSSPPRAGVGSEIYRGASTTSRNTAATSLGGTAFEVGSIVPRRAVTDLAHAQVEAQARGRMMSYPPPHLVGAGARASADAGMAGTVMTMEGPPQWRSADPYAPSSSVQLRSSPSYPYSGGYSDAHRPATSYSQRRVSAPVPAPTQRGVEDGYTRLPGPSASSPRERRSSYNANLYGSHVASGPQYHQQYHHHHQQQRWNGDERTYNHTQSSRPPPQPERGGGWGRFEYWD